MDDFGPILTKYDTLSEDGFSFTRQAPFFNKSEDFADEAKLRFEFN